MSDMLSGGDMVIRALQEEGVDCIFGYPGGAVLHIYDAIFKQQKSLKNVSVQMTKKVHEFKHLIQFPSC